MLHVSVCVWVHFPVQLHKACPKKTLRMGGGVLPYKRLMGMCRWMGLHFHDWVDYNGVSFLVQLHFRDFWDKKILVSRIIGSTNLLIYKF